MTTRHESLEARIGYTFRSRALLERALTHASYGDGRRQVRNNERLEFLGDRVLGLLVADRLFRVYETVDEGGLAPRLNALVRKEACAQVARSIDLGAALRVSKSEDRNGGRDKTSILGDACEALLAAVYLDGGIDAAQAFFEKFWAEQLDALRAPPRDAKTVLQEWAARTGRGAPNYQVVRRSGPDHRPTFTVAVEVAPLDTVEGVGASKQEAENAAAKLLLTREGAYD